MPLAASRRLSLGLTPLGVDRLLPSLREAAHFNVTA
jgi:hypothetical protein